MPTFVLHWSSWSSSGSLNQEESFGFLSWSVASWHWNETHLRFARGEDETCCRMEEALQGQIELVEVGRSSPYLAFSVQVRLRELVFLPLEVALSPCSSMWRMTLEAQPITLNRHLRSCQEELRWPNCWLHSSLLILLRNQKQTDFVLLIQRSSGPHAYGLRRSCFCTVFWSLSIQILNRGTRRSVVTLHLTLYLSHTSHSIVLCR